MSLTTPKFAAVPFMFSLGIYPLANGWTEVEVCRMNLETDTKLSFARFSSADKAAVAEFAGAFATSVNTDEFRSRMEIKLDELQSSGRANVDNFPKDLDAIDEIDAAMEANAHRQRARH